MDKDLQIRELKAICAECFAENNALVTSLIEATRKVQQFNEAIKLLKDCGMVFDGQDNRVMGSEIDNFLEGK